jgi:hypothetical protein
MKRNLKLGVAVAAVLAWGGIGLVQAGGENPRFYTVATGDQWFEIAQAHDIQPLSGPQNATDSVIDTPADQLQVFNNLAPTTSDTASPRVGWNIHIPEGTPSSGSSTTSTSSSSSSTSSTTTTAPSTTSSTSSTTTTTVAASTTTTAASTTTTVPSGGDDFVATFDTATDFFDRFDMGLSGAHPSVDPNYIRQWEGDHNHACEGPLTSRDVNLGQSPDFSELFWHCAPGGADTGHVMTSLNPLGYAYLWFSPKGYFTNVERVCWDQNLTNLGGRKWTQVSVSTRAEVERVAAEQGELDLGFSHPGFQDAGGPSTGVIPTDQTVAVWQAFGTMHLYTANHEIGSNPDHFAGYKIEDVATRYRHCMIDNGNGTITLTQENGTYSGDNSNPANLVGRHVRSATLPGSLPDGQVKVAFVDANYDPPKDGEYDASQNTWHFDNIEVTVA